ncbi:MAG TPA: helix-turn-helix transcriptional regulator [Dehalococcoidia bacterium]
MKRATRTREGYHWFRGWRTPSAAQRRVLDELVAGGTNAEIAQRLGISEDGVKWHLSELRQELEIDDRRQLAEWWRTRRERAGVFVPLGALGRLLGNHTAVFVAAVAVVATGVTWLAYASLDGTDDGTSTGRSASALPTAVPAVIVPTPTATPVPPTAVVFDVDSRSVTTLPGTVIGRRWLDTVAETFVGFDRNGLAVIDAGGETTPLPGSIGNTDYYPIPGTGQVIVWSVLSGSLRMVDVQTRTETVLHEFGRDDTGTRIYAISAASRRIALGPRERNILQVSDLDGSSERTVFTAEQTRGIVHAAWSPDGQRLLILVGTRVPSQQPLEPADQLIVVDAAGRVLLDRQGITGRWAGSGRLLVTSTDRVLGGRPSGPASFLSVPGGEEVPAPAASTVACVSPDSRYAVVVAEVAASPRPEFRHELYDLQAGVPVAEARAPVWLLNCDWTPDSRKAVLSPGGK